MLEYLGEFNVYSRRRRWREGMLVTYCYEKSLAVWPSLIWDSQERLLYLHWLHAILCWGFEWPRKQNAAGIPYMDIGAQNMVAEQWAGFANRHVVEAPHAVFRGMGQGEEAVNNFFVAAERAREEWQVHPLQEPEGF